MEKRLLINGVKTNFWIEDTGRLRNEKTKKWLKGGINKGYPFYSIFFRGKQYIFYTHRLVAEYFVPNPHNLSFVTHLDGDKTNNIYANLQWVSQSELNKKSIESKKRNKKETASRQKIKIEEYGEIAQFRKSPYYATKDGRIINISKRIEIRLEKSGRYLKFLGHYNLNRKHFLVHRAVWEAFNGEIPEGYDIDHIDGNPHNNSLDNLQVISLLENIKKKRY
jgi:hypothetical protein